TRPAMAVFFYQAEDGIRDFHVTGVQSCALPIYIAEATATVVALADRRARHDPVRARLESLFREHQANLLRFLTIRLGSAADAREIGRAACRERADNSEGHAAWRRKCVRTTHAAL